MQNSSITIQNAQQGKSIVNIEREVTKSLYGQLCGSLVDLERYEESKPTPSQDQLNFYLLARKALKREQSNFSKFSNEQAFAKRDELTSPVLKAIRNVDTPQERELIIGKYSNELGQLIKQTGVTL